MLLIMNDEAAKTAEYFDNLMLLNMLEDRGHIYISQQTKSL